MIRYLAALCKLGRFRTIVHRFPEPGHSFLPCDRSFGIIEKRKRLIERVYLPNEYMNLVRSCSKKFSVIEVNQNFIFDFSSVVKLFALPSPKNQEKLKFTISKYRIFKYSNFSDEIECCESASASLFYKFKLLKYNNVVSFDTKEICYKDLLPLKDAKYKNVMQLALEYVPKSDMPFYNSLKSTNEPLRDPASGTDGSESEHE